MSGLEHDPSPTRSPDGTLIATRIMGSGDGLPLLISNGIGAGMSMWRKAIQSHSEERRIVTWDHRGCFDSGLPARDRVDARAHAEDAVAALDHAGIERCVVAAWSSGGRIAIELAHWYPERVAGLALVCATYGRSLTRLLRLELGPLLPRIAALARPISVPLQGVLDRFVARPEIAGLIRQSGLIASSADTAALVELLQGLTRSDVRQLLSSYSAVSGDPARKLLARIHATTWVIAGENDRLAPPRVMEEMVELLPSGRLIVYSGATHFLPIEFPALLEMDLRALCDEVSPGGA